MRTWRLHHELAETGSEWGIRGLGLLRQDVRMAKALDPQDHLYTLVERGGDDPRFQIVGSIIDYRLAHDSPAGAVELAADPALTILSLTITEAGLWRWRGRPAGIDADDVRRDRHGPRAPPPLATRHSPS